MYHMGWKSEDNWKESVLFFDYIISRDGTRVVRLGGKHLCPLDQLTVVPAQV